MLFFPPSVTAIENKQKNSGRDLQIFIYWYRWQTHISPEALILEILHI